VTEDLRRVVRLARRLARRPARSAALAARLRGRLPSLGARRSRCRGPRVHAARNFFELRRSKTDQEAEGRPVASPETCPVRAVEQWLAHVRSVLPGYEHGPLFLRLDAGGRIRLGRLSDRGGWPRRRALGRAGRPRSSPLRWPQLARRRGSLRGRRRRVRTGHHESEWPPQPEHGPMLHTRRRVFGMTMRHGGPGSERR
jgi:hypothetical protein